MRRQQLAAASVEEATLEVSVVAAAALVALEDRENSHQAVPGDVRASAVARKGEDSSLAVPVAGVVVVVALP